MMKTEDKQRMREQFKEKIDYNELMNCTRCGFCLPSCPTYLETNQDEVHSPRGRIALMKGVVDGYIEPDESVKRSIDMCLGCRACEPVCPSGVKFGRLLEQAREAIYQNNKQSFLTKFIRNVFFKRIFPKHERMIDITSLLGVYQRFGFQRITHTLGIMNLFPETMQMMEKVLPEVPNRKQLKNRQRYFPPIEKTKKKVAFFSGCLMDTIFMETNDATIQLLQYAGCEIVIPDLQGCCGALQGHGGEREQAKKMAKRNIKAFEEAEIDYIVTNAGGCGAFLVDYDYLLKDEPNWHKRAKKFVTKIKDITSLLVELEFDHLSLRMDQQIVTYQDSCHLKNGQQTFIEPRKLLQSIEGVKYVEMVDAGRCCGSGGIYNLLESEMAMRVLDYKMEQAKQTKATTIVTTNPGCLLQMKLGVEKEGLSHHIEVVHIADFLLQAYENTYIT